MSLMEILDKTNPKVESFPTITEKYEKFKNNIELEI